MMGEEFFDCQIGVVGCRALCLKGFMGVWDFEKKTGGNEEVMLCVCAREHAFFCAKACVFVCESVDT